MNVEELYKRLKEAANYFGVGFTGFALIDAKIEEGWLVLRCDGQEIRFHLGEE